MKSNTVPSVHAPPYTKSGTQPGDLAGQRNANINKEAKAHDEKERSEVRERVINSPQLESMREFIGKSIDWRDMRFHQREWEGQYYVDIVSRTSGEIIRTVPQNDFQQFAAQFKNKTGVTLSVNG